MVNPSGSTWELMRAVNTKSVFLGANASADERVARVCQPTALWEEVAAP